MRIFHPETDVSPPSHRIIQDVDKTVTALKKIHEAKGAFVPGLAGGRIPGHRHRNTTEKTSNNHGGKRVRKEWNVDVQDEALHSDLKSLLDDPRRDSTGSFRLEKEDDGDILARQCTLRGVYVSDRHNPRIFAELA